MIEDNAALKKAAVFPGLGAEYPRMVETFLAHHPNFTNLVDSIINIGLNTATQHGIGETHACLPFLRTQLAVHALNVAWHQHVEEDMGSVHFMCGHSLGFYAALVAAKAISIDDSARFIADVYCLTQHAFSDCSKRVASLTTFQPFDQVILADMGFEILSINNNTQVLAYAKPDSYQRILEQYEDNILRIDYFPVNLPFHSVDMQLVCSNLENHRERIVIHDPKIPIVSHVNQELIQNSDSVRWHIINQLRLPVLWPDVIKTLHDYGVMNTIELGPNRILTQMMRWMDTPIKSQAMDTYRTKEPKQAMEVIAHE